MGKILRGKHERRSMGCPSIFGEVIWSYLFNIQTDSEANKNKQDFKPNKQREEMKDKYLVQRLNGVQIIYKWDGQTWSNPRTMRGI